MTSTGEIRGRPTTPAEAEAAAKRLGVTDHAANCECIRCGIFGPSAQDDLLYLGGELCTDDHANCVEWRGGGDDCWPEPAAPCRLCLRAMDLSE